MSGCLENRPALGRLLLKNATLVDVEAACLKRMDIGIEGGRFVSITGHGGDRARYSRTIDLKGAYAAPGLIDGHTHTELALMTVVPFAEMVIPKGTTTVILDCHDLVNVIGMSGLDLFLREAENTPLRAFFMVPPCVPSTEGVEDAGARITVKDVKRALDLPGVLGLAEVMDAGRLLRKEKTLMETIAAARKKGMIIDGHCPGLSEGLEKEYFRLSGAKTDHESASVKEILRKHRLSKWVHLRKTSLGREYPYKAIFKATGGERLMLSTDGCLSPADIMKDGHVSAFVRDVIKDGVDPIKAVAAATINPARCYGLDKEIGSIKKGKRADLVVLSDIKRFKVQRTFINGFDVGDKVFKRFEFPRYALETINLKTPSREDLSIRLSERFKQKKKVRVHVIGLKRRSLLTEKKTAFLECRKGVPQPDVKKDVLKAVVMERFLGKGAPVIGFVSGFGLKRGAFGGSIGQDCQHIVVIGCSDDDIMTVIGEIRKRHGGIFYSKNGRIKNGVLLPVAGIMTSRPPEETVRSLNGLHAELERNGVKVSSPYLSLSLQITLPAIPELKLTNRGLYDVKEGRFLSVVIRKGFNV